MITVIFMINVMKKKMNKWIAKIITLLTCVAIKITIIEIINILTITLMIIIVIIIINNLQLRYYEHDLKSK